MPSHHWLSEEETNGQEYGTTRSSILDHKTLPIESRRSNVIWCCHTLSHTLLSWWLRIYKIQFNTRDRQSLSTASPESVQSRYAFEIPRHDQNFFPFRLKLRFAPYLKLHLSLFTLIPSTNVMTAWFILMTNIDLVYCTSLSAVASSITQSNKPRSKVSRIFFFSFISLAYLLSPPIHPTTRTDIPQISSEYH